MASYSIGASEYAAYGKVLVAATVDTVTIAREAGEVLVTNDTGTDVIYFTVDGTTPAVAGASSYRVPAAVGASCLVPVRDALPGTTVKLISAGTPTYSVEAG